jgi:hypothetical protein
MQSTSRLGMGIAATVGLSALLMGLAGAAPARADAYDGYGRGHVYREVADVRRDEARLRDLQDEHDEARRCHDWRRMHDLDRRIDDLRRHINEDRRDIRQDVRHDRYRSDRSDRQDAHYRIRYHDDHTDIRYDR